MLYLPASWFHEVSSFNSKVHSQGKFSHFQLPKSEPGHIAFNFWMHPPTTENFELPYQDSFWQDEMEPAVSRYHELTMK